METFSVHAILVSVRHTYPELAFSQRWLLRSRNAIPILVRSILLCIMVAHLNSDALIRKHQASFPVFDAFEGIQAQLHGELLYGLNGTSLFLHWVLAKLTWVTSRYDGLWNIHCRLHERAYPRAFWDNREIPKYVNNISIIFSYYQPNSGGYGSREWHLIAGKYIHWLRVRSPKLEGTFAVWKPENCLRFVSTRRWKSLILYLAF